MEPDLSAGRKHSYDFTLSVEPSKHAVCRIGDRLSMDPKDVLQLINEGRAVRLSNPFTNGQNRGRYLFYSAPDKDFFVAIIAVSEISHTGFLITILTREQHEKDTGNLLESGYQKRAVQSALTNKEYAVWVADHFPPPENAVNKAGKYKNIRLNVEYWDENNGRKLVFISNPPISADELRSTPIRKLLDNGVFAQWLLERLNKKAVPIDRIISFNMITGVNETTELVI
ncbi:hypothetical protein [Dechloromonas sp. ZS-1]|uniref:hypothetical protein n=1 Tax=Dechloromonas sp. ZS-1 TaxID=3138067 RepID=UPI0031FD6D1A